MMTTNIHHSRAAEENFAGVPVFDGDFFADSVLADSVATFKMLRDLGPVIWMSRLKMFAVARYDEVLTCLKAADVLISGQGVSVNAQMNGPTMPSSQSTLTTDGMLHHQYKRIEVKPLGPGAIQEVRPRLRVEAQRIVDRLADGAQFDAMTTLAAYLPTRVVAELVGIKNVDAATMLRWSGAVFDAFGPADHSRTSGAIPAIMDFVAFGGNLSREDVIPGSWADYMLAAADRGELALETARNLLFDYVLPSLDTTIYSTGELVYQLASAPEAFETLRAQPELLPGAIYEAVRLASPLRGFTRYVSEDFEIAGATLPKGSRVFVLHAAANRDERHYVNPDSFDLKRNPRDHLGWGFGVHACSGMHLARAEMEVLVQVLLERVARMDLCGQPTRLVNNAAQGYASLPVKLTPFPRARQ